jgi:hypothetical protein
MTMLECIVAFVALNTLPIVFPLALSKEMNGKKWSQTPSAASSGAVKEFYLDDDDDDDDSFAEEENTRNTIFDETPFLNVFLCNASPRQVFD